MDLSLQELIDFKPIRIDRRTQKGSVIDIICIITGCERRQSTDIFKRLYSSIKVKCQHIKINGEGRKTWVANTSVLKEIATSVISKHKYAQALGENKMCFHKSDTIEILANIFKEYIPMKQYWINSYTIDLYLQECNIAIECNEHDRRCFNSEDEIIREHNISNILYCTFIRYNPHSHNFHIGNIISKIFQVIIKSLQTSSIDTATSPNLPVISPGL